MNDCLKIGTSVLFTFFLANLAINSSLAEESPMIIRYVNQGAVDSRHAYKYELIEQLLKVTEAEFGPYVIEPFTQNLSEKRLSVLISQGNAVNVQWGSPGTSVATADVIPIPVDILRGMLGYRVCLVNGNKNSLFDSVKDTNSLHNIRIGQVAGWPDISIYEFNKINIVQSPTFENLFTMLSYDRFDCLAVGVNEAAIIFNQKKNYVPTMDIDNHLLIAYYYPVYLYVNAKHPEIAKRLSRGMEKLQASKEFDRLFNRHFRRGIDDLNIKARTVLCLESPLTPKKNQCEHPEKMLNGF